MAAAASSRTVTFARDPPRIAARGGSTRVRCFEGLNRRTSDWDGWQKDHMLWFPHGDCWVHFDAPGPHAGSRLPFAKLPWKSLQALRCDFLDARCFPSRRASLSDLARGADDSAEDSGYASSPGRSGSAPGWELYLPAPPHLSPAQAFQYHLTTRNVLAYAVGCPLVGERLSSALFDLWRRLREWRTLPPSRRDFTAYLQQQGYLDFAENAEHALAALQLAGPARLREVGREAFAHCVGMHGRLDLSPEFAGLALTTCAAITCASLEMDVYIARVARALGGFLDDDLGPEHLGLSRPARDHLDRFRSFLHAHYVDRLGYFPPRPDAPWSTRLWSRLHRDFRALYDLLVDADSDADLAANRRLDGGICLLQNILAFDARHGFATLARPLPLLPAPTVIRRRESSLHSGVGGGGGGIRQFRRKSSTKSMGAEVGPRLSGPGATNARVDGNRDCALVAAYRRFEAQRLTEKLDPIEARKVRWMLIYGALQMLDSIMRAPREATDGAPVSYPLCVPQRTFPRWLREGDDPEYEYDGTAAAALEPPVSPMTLHVDADAEFDAAGRTSRISIRPDCEAATAEDYFAAGQSVSRRSQPNVSSRDHVPLSRTNSLRLSMHSSVQSLHRSVVGSLSRHGGGNNRRRSAPAENLSKMLSAVGDGVHADEPLRLVPALEATESMPLRRHSSNTILTGSNTSLQPTIMDSHALADFDFGFGASRAATTHREPIPENHQPDLDGPTAGHESPESPIDRRDSHRSSISYLADESAPSSECSCGEDQGMRRGAAGHQKGHLRLVPSPPPPSLRMQLPSARGGPPSPPHRRPAAIVVHAGCYVPSGLPSPSPTLSDFPRPPQSHPLAKMTAAMYRSSEDALPAVDRPVFAISDVTFDPRRAGMRSTSCTLAWTRRADASA